MKKSKLGPHGLKPTADAKVWVLAGCRAVKLINDFGSAAEYLAINPELIIIGRKISMYPNDPGREITAENLRHLDLIQAARFWVEVQRETYNLNPLIKIWEGPNEPQWTWGNRAQARMDMAWYGAFEAERVRMLAAMGLRAVVGNFSTGIPDIGDDKLDLWEAFLPALFAARDNGGSLGLHEYSSGPLSQGFDGVEGWNTFRYRKVKRQVLNPNGLSSLLIDLTEVGTDYKKYDINYTHELIWLDSELQKDDYLRSAEVFTFGSTSPAWNDFNMEGSRATQEVANHISNSGNVVPPQPATRAEGIDVSKWQGTIDWQAVANSGISFAITRVSDGLNVIDEKFDFNWQEIKARGLIRGAYQYFRPSQSGKAQADLFLSRVGKLGRNDLPPIVDVEAMDGVGALRVVAQLEIWIDTVKAATGMNPMIYTSPGFWNQLGADGFEDNELWVAHWEVANPLLPKGWKTWRLWQYTSRGTVPGIANSRTDRNRFNGTVEQLKAYVAALHPDPLPPAPPTLFPVGARVVVTSRNSTKALNVRNAPSGGVIGTPISAHLAGDAGTIKAAPVFAKLNGVNIAWVEVDFDTAPDGFVSQAFLDAQPVDKPNLLRNPTFKEGVYAVRPPFISGAWPVGWGLDWFYTPADPILGTGTTWTLAEMIVIEYLKQFPEDAHRFDKTDPFILNCFWAYGAVGFGWKQDLDLPAGRYRFTVPVKPDQWHRIPKSQWEAIKAVEPNHLNQPDADPNFWQVRPSLHTSDDYYLGSEVYVGPQVWKDAREVPFGQYTVLEHIYDHPGGVLWVTFGARGRWPFIRNGWMFDGLSLTRE